MGARRPQACPLASAAPSFGAAAAVPSFSRDDAAASFSTSLMGDCAAPHAGAPAGAYP